MLGVETQPLKPYSIVENDASITLYKNNRKVAEFSKKNHAEARTIEKLLMMIASEYNSNHNVEDCVYLCDRSYTVYDNTYKAKVENLIALYVTNDLKSYYYIALVDYIYNHTFKCLWSELGIRGIMTVQFLEEDRQNLVNYVQKIHFDQFDRSIAHSVRMLTKTNPEKVANTYECIQKRIYEE